jgi:hypothetical protein
MTANNVVKFPRKRIAAFVPPAVVSLGLLSSAPRTAELSDHRQRAIALLACPLFRVRGWHHAASRPGNLISTPARMVAAPGRQYDRALPRASSQGQYAIPRSPYLTERPLCKHN